MATPSPTTKIIAIPAGAITVQVEPLTGAANEVRIHILRNGTRAEIFSVTELRTVINTLSQQLNLSAATQPGPAASLGQAR